MLEERPMKRRFFLEVLANRERGQTAPKNGGKTKQNLRHTHLRASGNLMCHRQNGKEAVRICITRKMYKGGRVKNKCDSTI